MNLDRCNMQLKENPTSPSLQVSSPAKEEYKKQLKAEAAERKRLGKETWKAYVSQHMVHLGHGVFWNEESDWDKFDHPRAEERAQENMLPELAKPEHLAKALSLEMPELRWLTYHREAATSVHYQRFTIPKNNGSGERDRSEDGQDEGDDDLVSIRL